MLVNVMKAVVGVVLMVMLSVLNVLLPTEAVSVKTADPARPATVLNTPIAKIVTRMFLVMTSAP